MLVTAEPFLAVRSNNTGVYNFFQTFLTRFANVLAYAESVGYSRKATREALASAPAVYPWFRADVQDSWRIRTAQARLLGRHSPACAGLSP